MSDAVGNSLMIGVHLPGLTPTVLEQIVSDLRLPLREGRDIEWLAIALTRALSIAEVPEQLSAGRRADAEIRKEMESLGDLARSTWIALFNRSREVDEKIFSYYFKFEGGNNALDYLEIYRKIQLEIELSVAKLDWLSKLMLQSSVSIEGQKRNWRANAAREQRISRAYFIAPIFESAFDSKITINNYPNGPHKAPTKFMAFYQRIVSAAFEEHATPDLVDVLKTARELHRKSPVQFAEGVMPLL